MLRNRNVRTKLIAILVAPALALLVLATAGVWDRWQTAEDSATVGELATLASQITPVIHALQDERGITVAVLTGVQGDGLAPQNLADARAETDVAVQGFRDGVGAIDLNARGSDLVAALTTASDQIGRIADVRSQIDGGSMGADPALYFYQRIVEELLNVNGQISAETTTAELFTALDRYTTWSELVEFVAQERELLTQDFALGGWREGDFETFLTLDNQEVRFEEEWNQLADDQLESLKRRLLSGPEINSVQSIHYSLMLDGGGEDVVLDESAPEWFADMSARLDAMRQLETILGEQVLADSSRITSDAEDAVVLFAGLAAGAILAALLLASIVARSIVRPLEALTASAYIVSQEALPQLVERLRSPGSITSASVGLEPIEVESRDEIGRLAEAFNSIQTTAVQVATEQAVLLRKGIGEMFVNLARRNQSLLDRQISFLDELEATEQDPDRLEDLFKLDHLATRMRRNAESLLVLAGLEPARRWGKPVDLDEVVRAAVAEVEDYDRVEITVLDRSSVLGHGAVDIAHLLSELLENATRMSPPTAPVQVSGRRGDRAYLLSVVDRGVGMTAEAIVDANDLFANPPVVGLALSKSLGFIVIGRLSARFGIGVTVSPTPGGGLTATVAIPNEIIAEPDLPVTVAAPPARELPRDLGPTAELPSGADTASYTPAWADLPPRVDEVTDWTPTGLPKRQAEPVAWDATTGAPSPAQASTTAPLPPLPSRRATVELPTAVPPRPDGSAPLPGSTPVAEPVAHAEPAPERTPLLQREPLGHREPAALFDQDLAPAAPSPTPWLDEVPGSPRPAPPDPAAPLPPLPSRVRGEVPSHVDDTAPIPTYDPTPAPTYDPTPAPSYDRTPAHGLDVAAAPSSASVGLAVAGPPTLSGSHPEVIVPAAPAPVVPAVPLTGLGLDDDAPFQPKFVGGGAPLGGGSPLVGGEDERTASGLVRRRATGDAEAPAPRKLAQRESRGSDGDGEGRRRSPDEMRTMLARYRSGQERGRLGGPTERVAVRGDGEPTDSTDRGPARTEPWRDPR